MQNGYSRKELSTKLAIGNETLRYYEKVGIIPTPDRTRAGYRIYREEDLARLKFIKKAKDLGFSLREISSVFQLLSRDKNITNQLFDDQISAKIAEIDQKITALIELREALEYLKNNVNLEDCGLLNFFFKTP